MIDLDFKYHEKPINSSFPLQLPHPIQYGLPDCHLLTPPFVSIAHSDVLSDAFHSPNTRSSEMVGVRLLGFCIWAFLVFAAPAFCQNTGGGGGFVEGVAVVNGWHVVGFTDEDFICATLDWWPPEKCDYGTCSWGLASMLNLNLSSPILLNAVKEFSPIKLRLGGSLQDKVIYGIGDYSVNCVPFTKNSSQMFGFTQGCLPMSRWDELNEFFKKSGAVIIFGLNALNGRVPLNDGSLGGSWNCTNAASLIQYTVNKGYTIHGWELGNELSGYGVGTRIGSAQYANDVRLLKSVVDHIYVNSPFKPLVLSPGGFFDASWFKDLVDRTKPNSMDVITHHIYNLGPGVDTHLVDKILDPSYLNGEASTFSQLQSILRNAGTSTVAWVGEAGGAYNSGHHLVTDAFVFSFWYLDQLGMSASYDTKTYCRQSLIGGNYGLLNTTTYEPNPDYYSALLWHRLMGRKVLSTNFTGTTKIRSYAHCAKQSQGITLLLINLDGNSTIHVSPVIDYGYDKHTKQPSHNLPGFWKDVGSLREEYHLTAKDNDLHSQTIFLNGKALATDQDGKVPILEPVAVDSLQPIVVAPYSIIFAHIPYSYVPACM